MNTPKSYTCNCPSGCRLDIIQNLCIDINECEMSNACPFNSVCKNTFGSFSCECKTGFSLVSHIFYSCTGKKNKKNIFYFCKNFFVDGILHVNMIFKILMSVWKLLIVVIKHVRTRLDRSSVGVERDIDLMLICALALVCFYDEKFDFCNKIGHNFLYKSYILKKIGKINVMIRTANYQNLKK